MAYVVRSEFVDRRSFDTFSFAYDFAHFAAAAHSQKAVVYTASGVVCALVHQSGASDIYPKRTVLRWRGDAWTRVYWFCDREMAEAYAKQCPVFAPTRTGWCADEPKVIARGKHWVVLQTGGDRFGVR